MSQPLCPSCGEVVRVSSSARIGSEVKCGSCQTQLEVVWLDPIELDWQMEEEFESYYEDES